MRAYLLASAYVVAVGGVSPSAAQTEPASSAEQLSPSAPQDADAPSGQNEIVVTATRREERIQDVPVSVTAFQQEELTQKGIVGFEGIARETPGVVLNRPTQNFNNFTARGIATNGYNANLQSSVAVYMDELPISTIGNTTVVDPNLFDVERVEFLRGPQGTLFGSGSLSGAMRILTKSPDLNDFNTSVLVDLGLTGSNSFRQRYNAMLNIPVVTDKLAVRAVGFYRNEEGYLDNVGTGVHNSNTLKDYGGRALALWKPTDRLSIRLLGSYENSDPADSSLTSPSLGREKRVSDQPDRFTGKQTILNATLEYQADFATLTSSSTYSDFDQRFWLDLAGTFPAGAYAGAPIAFGLDANAYDKVFVQETRLASSLDGPLQFVVGGFYLHRRRDVDYFYRSSLPFLAARGLTGLPDQYYQKQYTHQISKELAGFGELTYRFSDKFWVTGGMRYGRTSAQGFTEEGGYLASYNIPPAPGFGGLDLNYFSLALGNVRNVAFNRFTPYAAVEGVKASGTKPSWKASVSYKPTQSLTTYATFSTGFRAPIVNAFAGRPSLVDPNDITIPYGAESDDLKSYEVGAKARFLNGLLTINAAAYLIDWSNIQAQANRVSDSVQFATNIGAAQSKGFEVEMGIIPAKDVFIGFNAAYNDAKITKLSVEEAAISGAVLGHRLSAPRLQGSMFLSYGFDLGRGTKGTLAVNAQYVGSYNSSFPNTPGLPNVPLSTFGETDEYVNTNVSFGMKRGPISAQLYIENVFDDHSVIYIHPEAFLVSRFGTLRPRTIGIRLGYGL
ncbi:TonB-dependent receptor [Sphingomonas xinjiangensis]|uniref:Outer membrane receptor protein involved in Fe transport n=1 Tax=Sphingomonas xinjiangensis TaxID=643568 RepID=A0A840YL59_9SPHN|nr:TonB-dependent receptor [Sphingomonas xinjiangensis]MBB5709940.1 outer membrane receptor protein involved in Fe transport [Sphingomonas xinjiangensis]